MLPFCLKQQVSFTKMFASVRKQQLGDSVRPSDRFFFFLWRYSLLRKELYLWDFKTQLICTIIDFIVCSPSLFSLLSSHCPKQRDLDPVCHTALVSAWYFLNADDILHFFSSQWNNSFQLVRQIWFCVFWQLCGYGNCFPLKRVLIGVY